MMARIVTDNRIEILIMANSTQLNLSNSIGLAPKRSNLTPLKDGGEL